MAVGQNPGTPVNTQLKPLKKTTDSGVVAPNFTPGAQWIQCKHRAPAFSSSSAMTWRLSSGILLRKTWKRRLPKGPNGTQQWAMIRHDGHWWHWNITQTGKTRYQKFSQVLLVKSSPARTSQTTGHCTSCQSSSPKSIKSLFHRL